MGESDRPEISWLSEDDKIRDQLVGTASQAYHEYFDDQSSEDYIDLKPRIMLAIDLINGIGSTRASIVLDRQYPKEHIPYGNLDELIQDVFRNDQRSQKSSPDLQKEYKGFLPQLKGYTDAQNILIDSEHYIYSNTFILIPKPSFIGRSITQLKLSHYKGSNPHGEIWIMQKHLGVLTDEIYEIEKETRLAA